MPLLLAALLGLSCLLIVIYPLLGLERARGGTPPAAPTADLAERERLAKSSLREVEFDYSLGNLEEADYRALRARYERRALAALKARYQRERALDAEIERQLAALRAQGVSPDAANPSGPPASAPKPAAPRAPRRAPGPLGPRQRRKGAGR